MQTSKLSGIYDSMRNAKSLQSDSEDVGIHWIAFQKRKLRVIIYITDAMYCDKQLRMLHEIESRVINN